METISYQTESSKDDDKIGKFNSSIEIRRSKNALPYIDFWVSTSSKWMADRAQKPLNCSREGTARGGERGVKRTKTSNQAETRDIERQTYLTTAKATTLTKTTTTTTNNNHNQNHSNNNNSKNAKWIYEHAAFLYRSPGPSTSLSPSSYPCPTKCSRLPWQQWPRRRSAQRARKEHLIRPYLILEMLKLLLLSLPQLRHLALSFSLALSLWLSLLWLGSAQGGFVDWAFTVRLLGTCCWDLSIWYLFSIFHYWHRAGAAFVRLCYTHSTWFGKYK